MDRGCDRGRALLAAHLCYRRGLSPLFLASGLRDQPGLPARARGPGAEHGAKERAVVGRQAPPPPSAFGYPVGCASAARHRPHNVQSDTEADVHSPRHKGFIYSHVGGVFSRRHDLTDLVKIEDFARYPELMWLHRYELVPAILLALVCLAIGGWSGLVVGFFWSTVAVYHATFCINSLAHVRGRKRHVTGDASRNNWLFAFFTIGACWHINHHAYQSSSRHGFRWWAVDPPF